SQKYRGRRTCLRPTLRLAFPKLLHPLTGWDCWAAPQLGRVAEDSEGAGRGIVRGEHAELVIGNSRKPKPLAGAQLQLLAKIGWDGNLPAFGKGRLIHRPQRIM